MGKFITSLRSCWKKTGPFREKTKAFLKKAGEKFGRTGKWAYNMRSIVLAIPVLFGAVVLAIVNAVKLPTYVGINLLADGEYALMVHKLLAVTCPLLITAVCLLLMFCSKKVAYPFLISLFSLAIPVLILITNVFPY
jgi:Ca2+/Na+ antiporter